MAKLPLNDVASGYNRQKINDNFTDIEAEFQDKVLYRDNPDGEPNQMETDIDMNSRRIYNLPDGVANSHPATYRQLVNALDAAYDGFTVRLREPRVTATAGQTVVNFSAITYVTGVNNIQVYVNGVAQVPGIDYTESDENTITFTSALEAGDVVDVYSNEPVTNISVVDPVAQAKLDASVVRVSSRAEMKAYDAPVDYQFSLEEGGRSGKFVVKAGTPPSDPEEGVYVVLANGNYAERIEKDPVNVKWFGAEGDGSTPDTPAFVAGVLYCVQNQKQLYCPAGTYILRPKTDEVVYLNKGITADGMGFSMFGDGRGKTIIKEGDGETDGRFVTMFYCWLADPDTKDFRYGNFTFRDMTFDKNGRSDGDPGTAFAWEGAHIIKFQGQDPVTPQIDGITFERIELIDKVGAGIVAGPASTVCRSLVLRDIQSRDHPSITANGGFYGEKGCIEVAIDSGLTTIESVNIRYSQIEPTFDYEEGKESIFKISNCIMNTFQYTYSSNKVSVGGGRSGIYIDAVNVETSDQFLVRGVHLQASGCTIVADTDWYPVSAKISSSKILLPYDEGTTTITPFYLNTPSDWRPEASFDNCEFMIDSDTVDAAASGYCVRSSNNTEALSSKATFTNCKFDPRAFGVQDSYSNGGNFKFVNCELAAHSTGQAFQVGAFSSRFSRTQIIDCDFSAVEGDYLSILENSSTYELKVVGEYEADAFTYGAGVIGNVTTGAFPIKPKLWGTAAPTTGKWPIGQKVYNVEPVAGGTEGWVCVTAGSPGTWKTFGVVAA